MGACIGSVDLRLTWRTRRGRRGTKGRLWRRRWKLARRMARFEERDWRWMCIGFVVDGATLFVSCLLVEDVWNYLQHHSSWGFIDESQLEQYCVVHPTCLERTSSSSTNVVSNLYPITGLDISVEIQGLGEIYSPRSYLAVVHVRTNAPIKSTVSANTLYIFFELVLVTPPTHLPDGQK